MRKVPITVELLLAGVPIERVAVLLGPFRR